MCSAPSWDESRPTLALIAGCAIRRASASCVVLPAVDGVTLTPSLGVHPAASSYVRQKRLEDVPPYIPRYTWLLSRYPNFLACFTQPLREVAVSRLGLEPGSRVLDIGCGTGASFLSSFKPSDRREK
jgi:hypothetical protein